MSKDDVLVNEECYCLATVRTRTRRQYKRYQWQAENINLHSHRFQYRPWKVHEQCVLVERAGIMIRMEPLIKAPCARNHTR